MNTFTKSDIDGKLEFAISLLQRLMDTHQVTDPATLGSFSDKIDAITYEIDCLCGEMDVEIEDLCV